MNFRSRVADKSHQAGRRKGGAPASSVKLGFLALALTLGASLVPTPSLADTDVVAFLNAALAKKKIILNRVRQMTGERIVCTMVADGRPHRDCQTLSYTYTQPYQDIARVTNQQILSVSQLQFDQANITQLPATVLIDRLNYVNCGEDQYNPGFNLSVTGTDSYSVAKTQTVSSTMGVQVSQTFTAGNGLFGGSTGIQLSFSMTLSNSTTNTETSSRSLTQGYTGTINATVGHAGYAQIAAIQQKIEVPFSAVVVVDGDMEDNTSGYTKASQLLTVQERTLPFSGTVTAAGLSDAYTGLYKPDEPMNCNDPRFKGQQSNTEVRFQEPLSSITADFAKGFGTPRDTFAKLPSVSAILKVENDDATTYSTIASGEVYVLDPQCGFDDAGHPKTGIHLVELRHYTTHITGTLHNEWDDSVDKFVRCNSM